MEDELQCAVCMDLFLDPVTLPCGHSMCKHCLMALHLPSCPCCRCVFHTSVQHDCKIARQLSNVVESLFPERVARRRAELLRSAAAETAALVKQPEPEEQSDDDKDATKAIHALMSSVRLVAVEMRCSIPAQYESSAWWPVLCSAFKRDVNAALETAATKLIGRLAARLVPDAAIVSTPRPATPTPADDNGRRLESLVQSMVAALARPLSDAASVAASKRRRNM